MTQEEAEQLVQTCRQYLAELIQGKAWIVANNVLVKSEQIGAELIKLGARKVLALGVTEGVRNRAIDSLEGVDTFCLNLTAEGGMMEGIRLGEAAFASPTPDLKSALERFDPNKEAGVVRAIFTTKAELDERPVFGIRDPRWMALEDKTVIDDFWADVGVPAVPSVVLPLELHAILEAMKELGQGQGVVIAGDNQSGIHGGASRTRWVRTEQQVNEVIKDLKVECATARVMPYLEGVPCSIHGWVLASGEWITLRPCEMLVRPSDRATHFDYLGAASNWKPEADIYEQMVQAAERSAAHLAENYQYRGVFTIDGVATKEGFFPTELNPRLGGALGRMCYSLPELPLELMHYATIEGHDVGIPLQTLRRLILDAADARPQVTGMIPLQGECPSTRVRHFVKQADSWISHDEQDGADLTLSWGPALSGALLFIKINPDQLQRGEAALPYINEAILFAQEHGIPEEE